MSVMYACTQQSVDDIRIHATNRVVFNYVRLNGLCRLKVSINQFKFVTLIFGQTNVFFLSFFLEFIVKSQRIFVLLLVFLCPKKAAQWQTPSDFQMNYREYWIWFYFDGDEKWSAFDGGEFNARPKNSSGNVKRRRKRTIKPRSSNGG